MRRYDSKISAPTPSMRPFAAHPLLRAGDFRPVAVLAPSTPTARALLVPSSTASRCASRLGGRNFFGNAGPGRNPLRAETAARGRCVVRCGALFLHALHHQTTQHGQQTHPARCPYSLLAPVRLCLFPTVTATSVQAAAAAAAAPVAGDDTRQRRRRRQQQRRQRRWRRRAQDHAGRVHGQGVAGGGGGARGGQGAVAPDR